MRALLIQNWLCNDRYQDIFEAQDENGNEIVLKVHRLGRTSFRAVRRQRDYMQGKSKASWLFMSRLAGTSTYISLSSVAPYLDYFYCSLDNSDQSENVLRNF